MKVTREQAEANRQAACAPDLYGLQKLEASRIIRTIWDIEDKRKVIYKLTSRGIDLALRCCWS